MAESPRGMPFDPKNLKKGHRYIKVGDTIIPCTSVPPSLSDGQNLITVLSNHIRTLIIDWDSRWITKSGRAVYPSEAEAMQVVFDETDVPVPEVLFTQFEEELTTEEYANPDIPLPEGQITMTPIPGTALDQKWDQLDDKAKESICLQSWGLISKIRKIPRPLGPLEKLYKRLEELYPSQDPVLEDLEKPARPPLNDSELQAGLHEGSRVKKEFPTTLPSHEYVFTHGDIAPCNIMVDDQNNITGILDWRFAGWLPEHWEYAQIMRPTFSGEGGDFPVWMDKTAPERWHLKDPNADGVDFYFS